MCFCAGFDVVVTHCGVDVVMYQRILGLMCGNAVICGMSVRFFYCFFLLLPSILSPRFFFPRLPP